VEISLLIETPDVPMRAKGNEAGIDFGVGSALFATSEGQLLRQAMLRRLRELDAILEPYAADLQRRGILLKTDPYYRSDLVKTFLAYSGSHWPTFAENHPPTTRQKTPPAVGTAGRRSGSGHCRCPGARPLVTCEAMEWTSMKLPTVQEIWNSRAEKYLSGHHHPSAPFALIK